MSPNVPVVSGLEMVSILAKAGFYQASQKGSHVKMKNTDGRMVIVPLHRELAPGTFRSILRQANWTIEEFHRLHRDE